MSLFIQVPDCAWFLSGGLIFTAIQLTGVEKNKFVVSVSLRKYEWKLYRKMHTKKETSVD